MIFWVRNWLVNFSTQHTIDLLKSFIIFTYGWAYMEGSKKFYSNAKYLSKEKVFGGIKIMLC